MGKNVPLGFTNSIIDIVVQLGKGGLRYLKFWIWGIGDVNEKIKRTLLIAANELSMNMPAGWLTLSHMIYEPQPSRAEMSPQSICSGPWKKLETSWVKVKPFELFAFQSSKTAFHAPSVSTEFQRFVWSIDASVISGVVHTALSHDGAVEFCLRTTDP